MAKKKKISKEMEQKLKDLYPESRALDMDRVYDAETMLDPEKPEDVQRWNDSKDSIDLRGFDDRSAREPNKKEVLQRNIRGDSGDGVIMTEPDRLVDPNSQAGKLIADNKDEIKDYASFIRAVKNAWESDDALPSLIDNISYDSSFQEMFKHPTIQGYIDENTKPDMINYIIKKFGVEPVRASNIINKLPRSIRAKLYHKAQRTRLPKIRLPKARPIRRPVGRQTTSRRRWSEQEINILRANQDVSPERATEILNANSTQNRSFASVRNKLYRIRRGEL